MFNATVFVLRMPGLSDVCVKMNLGTPMRVNAYVISLRKTCRVRVESPQVRYLDRDASCSVRPGMYNVVEVYCPNREYFDRTKSVLRSAKRRGVMMPQHKGGKRSTRLGRSRQARRTRQAAQPARTPRPRLAHYPR